MAAFTTYSLAFLAGGNIYCLIELLYRARTHYSMFFCSGLAVVILLYLYQGARGIHPILFGVLSAIVITALEFLFGTIFNLWLDMDVWDYSNVPLNLFGQICLPFSVIWFVFGIIIYYVFRLIKL